MECVGLVISHTSYVVSINVQRPTSCVVFTGSSSSGIGPLVSQTVYSSKHSSFDVTAVSGLNSVSENKSKMFKT